MLGDGGGGGVGLENHWQVPNFLEYPKPSVVHYKSW